MARPFLFHILANIGEKDGRGQGEDWGEPESRELIARQRSRVKEEDPLGEIYYKSVSYRYVVIYRT